MKKLTLIAITAFALSSCGSSNYLPCPAYANAEKETKVLSAHGQENDYYYELECCNCDEID
tara:strand:+ start:265 stop:447 length:183 start_codon:yes stop_codon:yes gene_type:complete